MRIVKLAILLFGFLSLIPIASAGGGTSIEITEPISLDAIIAEEGCPVGIRDENRDLEVDDAGLLVVGQRVQITRSSPLCDIAYDGEIAFFSVTDYAEVQRTAGTYRFYLPLSELAAAQNVCESAIRELNPEWVSIWETWEHSALVNMFFAAEESAVESVPSEVRIPIDSPACFQSVELAAGQHPRDLAQDLNICEQEIWYYNPETIYNPSRESRIVYIPLDYAPCFVDGTMRDYLGYPNRWGDYIPVESVTLEISMSLYDFAIGNDYCPNELAAYNRQSYLAPLRAGDEVYIPEGLPRCDYVQDEGKSLAQISLEHNVCMEALINANSGISSWAMIGKPNEGGSSGGGGGAVYDGIFVPTDNPPCYDENGLRIGQNDRGIHETSQSDWIAGIAQVYEVCVEQLMAANVLLGSYPIYELPSLIFIPDVPPCSDVAEDGFIHYRVDELGSSAALVQELSYIYNVCPSAILAANPELIRTVSDGYVAGLFNVQNFEGDARSYWLDDLNIGEEILIPSDALPCYDFDVPLAGIGNYRQVSRHYPSQIEYVCYEQEVDLTADYTGHEPEISPVPYSEDVHCYDRKANPQIILDNVRYTLYPWIGDAFLFELAECFGANAYDFILVDAEMLGLKTDEFSYYEDRYWGIPNASLDCPLIGEDREAALTWKRNFYQSTVFGTLNEDGEYGVTYGDTLSSIGRRYGYLPEWIMAENEMKHEWVYPYQRLRLPNYPNLYQMATYGGAALGGIIIFFGASFAMRLRANRRKGKKKNDE